ncbi:hypothetical protein BDR04DRAFT_1129987 [Suillus decipiens]|nr:hypothetical protein BDR04DRAFT_1129987 [Suillus decipiens]
MISHSHTPSTRETYGSGLLVYHVFCDSHNVLEEQCCPASSTLLLAFIASSWHLLHGQPWLVNQAQASLTLEGAKHLALARSTCPKQAPFTIELLLTIHSYLDLSTPLHAAIYSCLTMSFFTLIHTGKFTVPSLKNFDPLTHVHVSDLCYKVNRHGFKVAVFHLPQTKTSRMGEDVYWATQSGPVDLQMALDNHLAINKPSLSDMLFSWVLIDHLGRGDLKGHGIRIGGTLEYLLHRVPFNNVKMMGWWSSDTFVLYLRQHVVILAPFLQDQLVLEPFMRYALPA